MTGGGFGGCCVALVKTDAWTPSQKKSRRITKRKPELKRPFSVRVRRRARRLNKPKSNKGKCQ
jgi:galactokinase